MNLTPKQQRFVEEYLKNGNAVQSYRAAYDTQARPSTVKRNAHEVLHSRAVQTRLAELRLPVIEAAQYTLWEHIESLKRLKRKGSWA